MTIDYKDTIALPKTDFPMKAGLPKKEPELLARWDEQDLYGRMRAQAKGKPTFMLHDGPPYANGHLHIGHALNKILKDIINRSQTMMGKDAAYVPGWDCHGLPIEWKIEEQYRAAGKDKDEVPIDEFRKECREFADKWIDIQREEFKRLGVLGDWENPYLTMNYGAEAQIAREIGKFLMNGGLFKGAKPVLWSVVEKTALAEAEVEYQEKKSPTIWVRFPVVTAKDPVIEGASVVIWTTTPWTMPGNRAVCGHDDFNYALVEVTELAEGSLAKVGEKLVIAEALIGEVLEAAKVSGHTVVASFPGSKIMGSILAHPWRGQGYDHDVPLLHADYVTDDAGTGFVHTAPGHGADDYVTGQKYGLEMPRTVAEDGTFYPGVPMFEEACVLTPEGKDGNANGISIKALIEAGALLAKGSLRHSYPHSWRSKAPLIFRNTAQWFISMETNDLRKVALNAIDETKFYPAAGRNRLYSMIENRPDWCISRQRAWGVPIPVFVNKETGEPLRDQNVVDRVAAAFEQEGADAWFTRNPQEFLGKDYKAEDFEQVKDVVDVWFDSGSTHTFVLEGREDLTWPADLYLEGSDQHRGWFHSSLLESCGTRGRAPYKGVLTHGFVMAEDGRKMSKSLGNVVVPQEVNDQFGAEALRIWVVASNYSEDLRIGPEIIKKQVDSYRRLRNTLRWLLGNLASYDASKRVAIFDMPELDRWVLHRLAQLDKVVREACDAYDFHRLFRELHDFCALDLSAFYFDIRKDALYCDAPSDIKRLSALTVLDELFNCLTAWLAPILCFTAEEAWLTRTGDALDNSVHLREFPEIDPAWLNDSLAKKWASIRNVRRVVTGALEVERAEKRIGSSLQAAPKVYVPEEIQALLEDVDMAEVSITSAITLSTDSPVDGAFTLPDVPGVAVEPMASSGEKCERCWKVLPDVGAKADYPGVCVRCADAVSESQATAE
ncbi:isoleucine--tRNA ligase [Aestuariispira insulae]|uniref:Isoleucine--tRNA ligase n=1 Tax=Aestuariispira insulae TaxID=1461337 RepID=A0A3D9HGE2_9PROT|nr:isoleucine--tRNA ligase [Aestuariispira insulae]RED48530.1 isoleucyl-tRNA synthetase [Aestuariispira insulae]